MKKLPMLVLSMASVMALTGCGMLSKVMEELKKTPDDLPMTKEEARNAVKNYAEENNGVQFSYRYRDGEEEGRGYAGQKNGSVWEYQTVGGKVTNGYVTVALEDGSYKKYVYDQEKEAFYFYRDIEKDSYAIEDIYKDFGKNTTPPWLFYAHESPNTFSKVGESKVLERDCVDYEFTYKGIASTLGEEMEYTISIDATLGVTMKIVIYEGSSTSGRMNMDMTAIETGSDVVVPETVDPEPEGDEGQEGEEGEEGQEDPVD